MSKVRDLHDQAMKLAHKAMVARHEGDHDLAIRLANDAYKLEKQAADLIPEDPASEPTRSILYRSAASLALQCREFKEAQRLVARGLSGHPPSDIEEQLKDLYSQINFESHLLVRGVTLSDEELQVAIDGNAVGFGVILFKEYLKRIKAAGTMIDRTCERLMNKDYQGGGKRPKMYRSMTKAITTGREGSFTVTIRLSYLEGEQMSLLVTPAQVIDELITTIDLVNSGREDVLKERMPDKRYFTNFITLAREIAPDGDNVNFVGFTSTRSQAALTRSHETIELDESLMSVPAIGAPQSFPIEVEGVLDIAIGRGKEKLGLSAEDRKYEIIASEGMEDIVRTYFKQVVKVKGQWDGEYIYLSSLKGIEEE